LRERDSENLLSRQKRWGDFRKTQEISCGCHGIVMVLPAKEARMDLYGLKTCDTCRKAVKMLEAAGRSVRFVDVRAEPLSADQLAEFMAAFGDALVNTRSTTWRGLSEGDRKGAPADLLAAHPALMKRPVIRADDGTLYLGWGKEVQAALV
jgi:Spx/MgsR family transcriptional regulator